jgi:HrpA-like RNA helicase
LLRSRRRTFSSLALADCPNATAVTAAEASLIKIGAVNDQGLVTALGHSILDLPSSLPIHQVAMMIAHSLGCANQTLYAEMVFLIVGAGSKLLRRGGPTAAAMECFCAESDIVTLIRLVLPFLIDDCQDSELIERLGLNPVALRDLQSKFEELRYRLGCSQDETLSFRDIDHLVRVYAIVMTIIKNSPHWAND